MYKLLSLGEYKNHRLVTLTTDRVVYESRGINLILLNKTTFIAQSRYQILPLVVTSGYYQRSDRARF